MSTSEAIARRLQDLRQRIARACHDAGRDPADVTLIAVSKHHDATAIAAAYSAGQRDFGESYPAELRSKMADLSDLQITWHMVGHVQRNKAKWVAGRVQLVHSLHNAAGIETFDKRAAAQDAVQDVLLQVNLSEESSKRGCTQADVPGLAIAIHRSPHLRLRGLMTLPQQGIDPRPQFRKLRELLADLKRDMPQLDVLSMGMTADFAAAIAAGATHIRIGTAIFGARPAFGT